MWLTWHLLHLLEKDFLIESFETNVWQIQTHIQCNLCGKQCGKINAGTNLQGVSPMHLEYLHAIKPARNFNFDGTTNEIYGRGSVSHFGLFFCMTTCSCEAQKYGLRPWWMMNRHSRIHHSLPSLWNEPLFAGLSCPLVVLGSLVHGEIHRNAPMDGNFVKELCPWKA